MFLRIPEPHKLERPARSLFSPNIGKIKRGIDFPRFISTRPTQQHVSRLYSRLFAFLVFYYRFDYYTFFQESLDTRIALFGNFCTNNFFWFGGRLIERIALIERCGLSKGDRR